MLALVGVAAGVGCKPEPVGKQEDRFRRELRRYFNTLNAEAQARKDSLRKDQIASQMNPALLPPTGFTYSTWIFDDKGFIVENLNCQTCGNRLALTAPSAEYLCKSCGHCPYKTHPPNTNILKFPCETCIGAGGTLKELPEVTRDTFKGVKDALVLDMVEIDPDRTSAEKGIRAKVRYVRRTWIYDPRGVVPLSERTVNKASIDTYWIPTEGAEEKYRKPGFHRQEESYIGEIDFLFKGGELIEMSRKPEEPVRPWKDIRAH
jgi:hypothetical protein